MPEKSEDIEEGLGEVTLKCDCGCGIQLCLSVEEEEFVYIWIGNMDEDKNPQWGRSIQLNRNQAATMITWLANWLV
jgi:hypothetical protein